MSGPLVDLNLPAFSDAELAAVCEVSVAPLLHDLAASELEAAVAGGRRSLVARGYLGDDGPLDDLATVVGLRSNAAVVAIADLVGAESGSIYYYASPAGVLEERVEGTQHAFSLRTLDAVARALAGVADPHGRAGDDGPLLHATGAGVPDGWDEVEDAIARATQVVQLYVVARASEEEVQEFSASVAATDDGVWFVSGHADPATGVQELWARRLGRDSLEVALVQLLGGPLVPAA